MLKLPNLFGRTPKHQKFSFDPRFYDPLKEEMKEREERIKRDLETEQDKTVEGFQTRIKGSFHSARKRSSATEADLQASVIRIVALLFLVIMLIAYLQWGSQALYGFLIIVPLYGWLKFRK